MRWIMVVLLMLMILGCSSEKQIKCTHHSTVKAQKHKIELKFDEPRIQHGGFD